MFAALRASLAIAAGICVVVFAADRASAGGPWGRATGEAVELRRTTEDLRNRLERLFPGSPAAAWSVQTDELAKQIKLTTDSSVSKPEFDALIESFCVARDNTAVFVGSDPYIAGDERSRDYLEEIDKRLERFIKDLSKAKVPATHHYVPGGFAPPAYPPQRHESHDHHQPSYAVPGYEVRPQDQPIGIPSYSYGQSRSYQYSSPYAVGRTAIPSGGSNEYRSYRQPTYRQGIELRVPPVVVEPSYVVPRPRIAF